MFFWKIRNFVIDFIIKTESNWRVQDFNPFVRGLVPPSRTHRPSQAYFARNKWLLVLRRRVPSARHTNPSTDFCRTRYLNVYYDVLTASVAINAAKRRAMFARDGRARHVFLYRDVWRASLFSARPFFVAQVGRLNNAVARHNSTGRRSSGWVFQRDPEIKKRVIDEKTVVRIHFLVIKIEF